MEAHDAETDWAVTEVGDLRGLGRVEVDVDDVVEGTDGHMDGLRELGVVDIARGIEVGIEDDGAEITDGGLIGTRVERDFGTEVGRVDDAHVVLRRTDIARILKGHPRVARLEDHIEHLLPELNGRHGLAEDFAFLGLLFVGDIATLEIGAESFMQVGDLVGHEERPVLAIAQALHEQVGNPVRRVHVVGAAAVVAGVTTELKEVFDVVVPRLEVGAAGATALTALVDRDELVVVQLKERHDALRFTVGALDVRARATDSRPRTAQTARPLGEEGVLRDAADHDRLDGVIDLVEVAGRQLAMQCTGIEKRRGRTAEAARLVERVEADSPLFAIRLLAEEEAHGNAHPEELGRLEATVGTLRLVDDQIAVVEGLHAEELEIHVGHRVEGVGQLSEVVAAQVR